MTKKVILIILIIMFCWTGSASGRIVMEFDLSAQPRNREVKLWIPYPVSSQHQNISEIKIDGDFAESAVYTDKTFRNTTLYTRWNQNAKNRKLTLSFTAVRQEVVRRNFPDKETAWSPVNYQRWLQPSSLGPIDGPVKILAEKITTGKTTVLDRAKAIYDWTCDNMYRDAARETSVSCCRNRVANVLIFIPCLSLSAGPPGFLPERYSAFV